jgi:NADH dehydrogenase [ubiquinone] 1 alpha subcomplex assembly factor 6
LVAYHAGIGLGLVTALRGARIRLARGECSIPKELIAKEFPYHKFNDDDPKSDLTESENKMLKDAVQQMVQAASSHLTEAKELQSNIPKHARSCFLPVVPALHYLSKLEKADYDIFDDGLLQQDQLSVLALLGRTWLTGVF